MKFGKLLKKELKELLTVQALIGIVVMGLLFFLVGNIVNTVGNSITDDKNTVVISDRDQSKVSAGAIAYLNANGTKVTLVSGETSVELIKEARNATKKGSLIVIPKGFGEGINAGKPQTVEVVSELTSFAMASDTDNSTGRAVDKIGEYVINNIADSQSINVSFINEPILTTGTTVVGEKSASADPEMLKSFGMAQSIFIPVIVFLLVMMATQLNCAAIANEKTDKTLETLLSTPVSRLDVIGSKMCASAVYSLLMAGIFIVGFGGYMGSMMGGSMGSADLNSIVPTEFNSSVANLSESLEILGIKLGGGHFLLLGVQLFLTIAIALTISMILGALAKDIKATQGLITPLMFATLIPYMVTMFADVNTLPTVIKAVLYAIPFTHTFTATGNVLFGNMGIFYFGLAYQAIWLVGVVWLAVKVFSSDKIFTMTLEFKKKTKKVAIENI